MRGSAGTPIADGKIRMDLRFAIFKRIARDDMLRRLLVSYADRLDACAAGGPADDTCYLTLQWADNDQSGMLSGCLVLTARAHLPRCRWCEHEYLDFVLDRLEAALAVDEAEEAITVRVRRRCATPDVLENGADAIFKTRRFDVTSAPSRPGALPSIGAGAADSHLAGRLRPRSTTRRPPTGR
jgi:hypothetical protein